MRPQHGGGYAYRLCPASSALTEACFQRHPLQFAPNKSALLLPGGSRIPIAPLRVTTGTQVQSEPRHLFRIC
eukprot:SAG11_NODE_13419_length_656_cov_0.551167_1_plen_72_part_00